MLKAKQVLWGQGLHLSPQLFQQQTPHHRNPSRRTPARQPHFRGNVYIPFEIAADKYPGRSYCLQYRETDLAFIEQPLFEEGMTYRFAHNGDEAGAGDETEDESGVPHVTLIIFDDPYNLPQATQGAIRFHRTSATESADSLACNCSFSGCTFYS